MKHLSARSLTFAITVLTTFYVYGAGQTPAELARGFYVWYIHELLNGGKPLEQQRATVRRFVSEGLLARIESERRSASKLNRDPFLDTQEIDPEWARSIAIGNIFVGRIARLNVALTGRRLGDRELALKLVQENGAWKIDEVKFD
ncbi:MAG: hypothetical protein QOH24_651 [Verrucomicrobiota bacterium]|jgi:hypothetical protein